MRIEQPAHLKAKHAESAWLQIGHPLWPMILLLSGLVLAMLGYQFAQGTHVAASQWIVGAAIGPIAFGVVRLAFWFAGRSDHYAEVKNGRARIGKWGFAFPQGRLYWCRLEQDDHFQDIYRLTFCFQNIPVIGVPVYWHMMVEVVDQALAFQSEVMKATED